jgi:hypothetical protein
MSELAIQYVPHSDISHLTSEDRIKKLLKIVKDDKIAIVQGRLLKHEETDLIQKTMELIDRKFKGIELAVIYPQRDNVPLKQKIREQLVKWLSGPTDGLTIIGPASIVSEIKQNPNKIELFITVGLKKE